MQELKVGFTGSSRNWRGVLRDSKGGIVWKCEHRHRNRDQWDNMLKMASACDCAKQRLREMISPPAQSYAEYISNQSVHH